MKKAVGFVVALLLSLTVVSSSAVIASAETIPTTESDSESVVIIDAEGDPTRAYELVWKYIVTGGHLYKRRWNATLGMWYDPDWILVY